MPIVREELWQDIDYVERPNFCALCGYLHWLYETHHIDHQPNFTALEASASNGCRICTLIHDAIMKQCLKRPNRTDVQDIPEILSYLKDCDGWQPLRVSLEGVHYKYEAIEIRYERRQPKDPARCHSTIGENNKYQIPESIVVYLPLYSLRSDNVLTATCRPVLTSQSFELCKHWLHHCSKEHHDCGDLRDRPLPTRLIDVGSSSIKLCETRGKDGQYVTLSHCWGGVTTLMTIQENLEEHFRAIPHEKLPKTFRDAVTITRALGFVYLWIDSLCIIQDKRSDWEIECSQMDQVFQNSSLTIAAPDAANAIMGMLHDRIPPKLGYCSFPTPPGKSDGELLIGPDIGFIEHGDYIGGRRTILSSRAWVLQERLMSPRVLFFGAKQLYYECQIGAWYESRWEKHNLSPRINQVFSYIDKKTFYGNEKRDDNWKTVVEDYSHCFLSCLTDKLPALAGIAKRFARMRNDVYLAGLWQSNLVYWLLWEASSPTTHRIFVPRGVPSWSWVRGHVRSLH